MRKLYFIALIFILALFSCNDEEGINDFNFREGKSFVLNEDYTSNDNTLTFRIVDMQDSRCPEGVYCIWQGEAKFKVAVDVPVNDTIELSTFDKKTGILENYHFELIEVSPYPVINTEIRPEDYRVRLIITN